MISPENHFADQYFLSTGADGAVDLEHLKALVIEGYRHDQAQVTLSKEAMDTLQARNRTLADGLQILIANIASRSSLFDLVLENVSLGFSVFDSNQGIVVWNSHFCSYLGIPPERVTPGVRFDSLRAYIDGEETVVALSRKSYLATGNEGNRIRNFEWQMRNGRVIHVAVTVLADGHSIVVHQDVTEERQTSSRLLQIVHQDPLTKLPNRLDFHTKMEDALERLKTGEQLGLLVLNLDFFKTINDTLGAATGDAVLKVAAQRLATAIGPNDLIARLGSDEFAILQIGVAQPKGARDLSDDILRQLAHPFELDNKHISLSASIGTVIAPDFGRHVDMLIRNAGLALTRAKAEGRKTMRYFEPDMEAQQQLRREREFDLRRALENSEFELYFQPIYDLHAEKVTMLEALIRWNHPTRGRVSPMEFIPLAEEMGLIVEIGRWVLSRACLDAAQWPDDVKVSVNISAIQVKSASLLDDVLWALGASGLSPERLDLEITESVIIQNRDHALSLLHELKKHGISISMDDFGTGYSSLSYLRSFPFDKIKIDKSFVDDIVENEQALAVIRAIIFIGKTLKMAITVEGVESAEQFALLQKEDCDQIQGYYIDIPRPVGEAATSIGSSPTS